jgi:sulfatase maturation enzyme AslB (radical SAM superfamily)
MTDPLDYFDNRVESDESVMTVITGFAHYRNMLSGERTQRLCYLADAHAYEEFDERLFDVEWRPYMYGFYSEAVEKTFEDALDRYESARTMQNGKRIRVIVEADAPYYLRSVEESVVGSVLSRTNGKDNTELSCVIKQDERYQRTEYDQALEWE